MTTENYSIFGLKDLLNDLEHLSNCIMTIPQHHIDDAAYYQLIDDQHNLIQKVNAYAWKIESRDLTK